MSAVGILGTSDEVIAYASVCRATASAFCPSTDYPGFSPNDYHARPLIIYRRGVAHTAAAPDHQLMPPK